MEKALLLSRVASFRDSSETIELDVGGTHKYKVFKRLLTLVPESSLAKVIA